MTRKSLDSPLGQYKGRAIVVAHEGHSALSLWGMVHAATGSQPIRNAARFVPANMPHHALGTVLDVTLVRQSPRKSLLTSLTVVDSDSDTGLNASDAERFAKTVADAKSADTTAIDDDAAAGAAAAAAEFAAAQAQAAAGLAARNAEREQLARDYEARLTAQRIGRAIAEAAAAQLEDEAQKDAMLGRIIDAIAVAASLVPQSALDELCQRMTARDYRGYRLNHALVGPSGCGKSTIAALAAERFGARFGFDSFGQETAKYELMGRREPAADGNGFVYLTSTFVDFYENGGVYLADEFDAADANTVLAFNAALANGHMFCSERIGNERVVRHADFHFIAAVNTWGTGSRVYVGRNELDTATLDRLNFMTVDYDIEYEAGLLEGARARGVLRDSDLIELADFRTAIREVINASGLRRVYSTRKLSDWIALREAGITLAKLRADYFGAWSVADTQSAAQRGLVPQPARAAR